MSYRTHTERQRLAYAVAACLALSIAAIAVLGASPALETCLASHSADTCHYALR